MTALAFPIAVVLVLALVAAYHIFTFSWTAAAFAPDVVLVLIEFPFFLFCYMFRYALIHVFIFCIQHGRHQAGELLGYILPNHLFPLLWCDMNVKYPLLQVKVCIGESFWPCFKPLPSIFVNLLEFCRLGDFLSELPWIRYLIGNVNSMIRLTNYLLDYLNIFDIKKS